MCAHQQHIDPRTRLSLSGGLAETTPSGLLHKGGSALVRSLQVADRPEPSRDFCRTREL